jgi:type II secretory pathway pseudopilin PulG
VNRARKRQDDLGMSLVEVLVAAGMLGIVTLSVSKVILNITKQARVEEQRSTEHQVLSNIVKDVLANDAWMPPQPPDTNLSDSKFENRISTTYYDDQGASTQASDCATAKYDATTCAALLKSGVKCFFKVRWYKKGVFDQNYPNTHSLASLPMSFYEMEVTYCSLQRPKTLMLTRYVTNYLRY